MDLATQMVAMSSAKTQNSIAVAVMRQQFDMQKAVLQLLGQGQAPLPPGQGTQVDKTA